MHIVLLLASEMPFREVSDIRGR